MGLSEHALQYHMSDWSSCAIWDPYVARDPNPTRMAVSGEKNGFGTKNRVSAFYFILQDSKIQYVQIYLSGYFGLAHA